MAERRTAAVASVTDSFIDLQRTVRQSKARLLAAAGNDVESATHLLLHTVESDGPMRASALAASVHADLSTVSRQVVQVVANRLNCGRDDRLVQRGQEHAKHQPGQDRQDLAVRQRAVRRGVSRADCGGGHALGLSKSAGSCDWVAGEDASWRPARRLTRAAWIWS